MTRHCQQTQMIMLRRSLFHYDLVLLRKFVWPETRNLTSVPGKFDFEKLPSIRFDSAGFSPFPKPPEESILTLTSYPMPILIMIVFPESR